MQQPLVKWNESDLEGCGHGVGIYCDHDSGSFMLAFIEGFGWRGGARGAQVSMLDTDAVAWALFGSDANSLREQIRAVVSEVLAGGSLRLRSGIISVYANA